MFNMKKKIKEWGNSAVLVFTKEDLDLYDIDIGDIIEFTPTKITKLKSK